MKKILFLYIVLFSMFAMADIETDTVSLRTMDKITGRVQKISVNIGEEKKVGPLTVFVKKCLKKPPEETPENAAFLTVVDEDNSEKPVFQGWMFSSNPALSAMEHPVYDIWVVECIRGIEQEPVTEISREAEDKEENLNKADETDEPIED